jgi:nucleotide-binding universal stress UspA family protein
VPLQWAIDESVQSKANLVIVHCIDGRLSTEMPYSNEVALEKGRSVLKAALDFAQDSGADVDAEVLEGFAGEVLVERAADARVLVIGSPPVHHHLRLLQPSVVRYCIRHSHCPLAVVPLVGETQSARVDFRLP